MPGKHLKGSRIKESLQEYLNQKNDLANKNDLIPDEEVSLNPLHDFSSHQSDRRPIINIAILDDDFFTLTIVKDLIEKVKINTYRLQVIPFHIKTDQSVEQFKKEVSKGRFQGILTDNDMLPSQGIRPAFKGIDVIALIKNLNDANLNQIPIFLNSAQSNFKQKDIVGANVNFKKKPININDVEPFIIRVVDYYEALKTAKSQVNEVLRSHDKTKFRTETPLKDEIKGDEPISTQNENELTENEILRLSSHRI